MTTSTPENFSKSGMHVLCTNSSSTGESISEPIQYFEQYF